MPQSLNNLGGTILIFPVGGSRCQMSIVGVNCSLCLPPMSLALIQVLRSALDVDVLRCGVGSWKLIPLLSVSMRRTIPPSEVMGIGPLLEPKETVRDECTEREAVEGLLHTAVAYNGEPYATTVRPYQRDLDSLPDSGSHLVSLDQVLCREDAGV